MSEGTPPVFGLVLAGGKSKRMGQDKGLLAFHGQPQRDYLFELLQPFCEKTFYSIREDQVNGLPKGRPYIVDLYEDLGPKGAILSAFTSYPQNAWLVVATDLFLLDKELLQLLLSNRNPNKKATVFLNKETGYYEPLIAIWEPAALDHLTVDLEKGLTCPRKTLMNMDVQLIQDAPPAPLTNVNNPETLKKVIEKINHH